MNGASIRIFAAGVAVGAALILLAVVVHSVVWREGSDGPEAGELATRAALQIRQEVRDIPEWSNVQCYNDIADLPYFFTCYWDRNGPGYDREVVNLDQD